MGYGKLDRRRRDRYEVDQGLCVGYSNRVYWGRLEGMGLEADAVKALDLGVAANMHNKFLGKIINL